MIAVRAAREEDAGAIAAIYAPFVLGGVVSFETEPPDAHAIHGRMTAGDGLYPWLVATRGDAPDDVVAYAYATRFRERPAYRYAVETSIYTAADAQRQGTGRVLYETLIRTLRTQGFVHAIGVISLPNDASIALHERIGFVRAGVYRGVGYKDGRWVDVGLWQCALNEPRVPPVEPKRFADVGLVQDQRRPR